MTDSNGKQQRMRLPAAAEYLGVTERFMRRLVFEGRIDHYKLGPGKRSPVIFDTNDLDAFLTAHRKNCA